MADVSPRRQRQRNLLPPPRVHSFRTVSDMKPKHIPIRTCVACRETDEKRDLLRVVRLPDGSVVYDAKAKAFPGRGAYVCATEKCIALARKQRKLERSLKVDRVSDEFV